MNDMAAPLALVVDGDAPTRAMVRFLLEDHGCAVTEIADTAALHATPGAGGAALLVVVAPDHDHDFLSPLGMWRRAGYMPPTALLVRHGGLELRKRAFAAGVQAVIELPAEARELQTRLRAVMGTHDTALEPVSETKVRRAGNLVLRVEAREVGDGAAWSVKLTQHETALLHRLMLTPGQMVGHRELLDYIWSSDRPASQNGLAVLVRRLRAKLTPPGVSHPYVHTVHGQGYIFDARSRPRFDDRVYAGDQLQVMVVDDDRPTVGMICEVLRLAGYSVAVTEGVEAPSMVRRTLPRLILLDINMPGMTGVEVRRHLRHDPRTAGIPVIATSAGYNLRFHAGEMAADDYLAKPFSTDELLLRIRKLIGASDNAGQSASDTTAMPGT